MFRRGLTRDVFGELLETGKAAKKQASQIGPGKILSTAGKQLFGAGKAKKPEKEDETFKEMMKVGEKDKKEGAFDPTKVTNQQLQQMRTKDARQSLENYRKVQQQLLELYLKEKREELPVYQAGKPGAARTYKEEKELIEKKRKEEEEKKKKKKKGLFGGLLPQSARRMPRLGIFVKQKTGTGEIRLGKQG